MNTIAFVIIALTGFWMIGLAAVAIGKPDLMKRFFDGFASSARTHFLEMFLRLLVGAAFVVYSPGLRFPTVFSAFGYLLIITTAVLIFVPWKIHRRFAEQSLPIIYRFPIPFALVSFAGGLIILTSLFLGRD